MNAFARNISLRLAAVRVLAPKHLLLAFVLAAVGAPLRADTRLVFPRVTLHAGEFTGLALANPTASAASLTFRAYNPDGTPLSGAGVQNPAVRQLAAGTQMAVLSSELFLDPSASVQVPGYLWVEMTSPTDGLTGFFLEGSSALDLLDGADLTGSGTDLLLPLVSVSATASTDVSIINTEGSAANIAVDFLRADGTIASAANTTIPPLGALQGPLSAAFPLDYGEIASLRVRSDQPVVVFGFLEVDAGASLVTFAAVNRDLPSRTLYFPSFSQGQGWSSVLGVVNTSARQLLVTVTAYKPDGTLIAAPRLSENPITRTIAPSGVERIDLGSAFGFRGTTLDTGWLKVEATESGITGYLEYGSGSNRTVTASQWNASSRSFFSHQATTSPFFTNLSILNTASLAANVEIVSITKENAVAGIGQRVLKPGHQESLPLQDFIPAAAGLDGGAVFVKSDVPIIATQVFGTDATGALANVPPQQAPEGYDPGANLPRVSVFPPLAVVETNKSQKFTVAGAADAVWLVNGIQGGSASTGTVSAAGLFTAPQVAPAAHTLVVQASAGAGSQSAAASVDVVQRETLTSGLTLVTAVAYLVNLERYFIAEQQILSSPLEPRAGEAQAPGSSSLIREQTPNGAVSTFTQFFDTIGKMLPFVDGGGTSYLLIAGVDTGNIYRLRIDNKERKIIASGLRAPNSLALDPVSGNLLVSEGGANQITTIPRAQFDPSQSAAGTALEATQQSEAFTRNNLAITSPQGVAFDSCTGAIYVSTLDGRVLEYLGNIERVVASRLDRPSEMLVLHRTGVSPCSSGVSILVCTAKGIYQISPRTGSVIAFLTQTSNPQDLTFFAPGNPFTPGGQAAVAVADAFETLFSSLVYRILLGDLYTVESPVPVTPVGPRGTEILYLDPVGDTFASDLTSRGGLETIDLVSLDAQGVAGSVVLTLTMSRPVSPHGAGLPNSLSGFVDLDYAAGTRTHSKADTYNPLGLATGLGVDASIDLSDGTISEGVLTRDPGAGEPAGQSGVQMFFLGNNVVIKIPGASFDVSKAKITVGVGNRAEITDVAPNERFIGLDTDDGTKRTVQFARTGSAHAESSGSVPIEVRLSSGSAQPVSVNYAVTGGTATAGSDFSLSAGTLTFAPGETIKTITLRILNDGIDESAETVIVTLSSAVNGQLGTNRTYTCTIEDDEAPPTVSFSRASGSGSEATAGVQVSISLSHRSSRQIVVEYEAVGGTATAGADYVLHPGSVTIEPGGTSATIRFNVIDDTLQEGSETIVLALRSIRGASSGSPSQFTYTIQDNEPVGPTVQFAAASSSHAEDDQSTVLLTVTLSQPLTTPAIVALSVSGTATPSGDYIIETPDLYFDTGITQQELLLFTFPDGIDEPSETVVVTLLPPTGIGLGPIPSHTLTILDADPTPTVGFGSLTTGSGPESASAVTIPLTLSNASSATIQFQWSASGTAGSPADFTPASGTVTFAPGVTAQDIALTVVGDQVPEPDETIVVSIAGTQLTFTYTIIDDEPRVEFDSASSRDLEDNLVESGILVVRLTPAQSVPVTVPYSVSGGTAVKDVDYHLIDWLAEEPLQVTFQPGETEAFIDFVSVGDTDDEPDETFVITLGQPLNGLASLGAQTSHTFTLLNDDLRIEFGECFQVPPSCSPIISAPPPFSGLGTHNITMILTAPSQPLVGITSGSDVTFNVEVTNAFPTGTWYTPPSGPFTIQAGSDRVLVPVEILSPPPPQGFGSLQFSIVPVSNARAGSTSPIFISVDVIP